MQQRERKTPLQKRKKVPPAAKGGQQRVARRQAEGTPACLVARWIAYDQVLIFD